MVKKMKMSIYNFNKKVFIAGLVFIAVSCGNQKKQGWSAGPVPVNLYTVSNKNVSFYNSYVGTVEALNQVEIRSEVSGYVTGIFFKDGSQVEKGQRLYEIDKTNYQTAYDQAKAAVDIANANLDKAQRDAERYSRLAEQDAVAKQIAQDALTALENARLQLASAEAGLQRAKTNLDYAIIKAPFSGSIGFSQVKMGTYINPGQTLMNTISSDDPIGVDLQIDENELGQFLELQQKSPGETDSTFRLILPGHLTYPQSGQVSAIDRAVDPQAGTIRVRLVFPNNERELRDGMNITVKVLDKFSGNPVVIPFKAVLEQMSEYFVYVADSGKVRQRKITAGPNMDGELIVMTGLKTGEQIVLDGVQKLRDGMPYVTGENTGGNSSPAGK
jgi:RND family efflux transporter MFP subunit